MVTNYTGTGISDPSGIAAGPDGALWFTNYGNNSIGRITTAGTVTNYTGTGISSPAGIAAGPDGALWFTNCGNNSIGRITTTGSSPTTPAPASAARPGSRPDPTAPCGSPTPATTRSGGSPPPGRSPTTPAPASAARTGSRPGPTAPCGSPTTATTRSGGSPPPGRSPTTPAPASATRTGSRPGPTAPCGSPTRATTRSGGSPPRDGHQLHRRRHQRPGRDRGRARRRPVVHQPGQQLDRADHHHRDGHQLHRRRHQPARRDRGRTRRRPVVHQPRQQLDRADHHRRDGHQLHRHRHQRPGGIAAGPDGALWFTNHGNNSIGRITTTGTVTNYTGTGISGPPGSRPGPTAPCGSPTSGNNSIGRITTTGTVTNFTGTGISSPAGIAAGTRRRPVVHQPGQQLDRADHHHRDGHQLHRHRHQRPGRDHGRARRRPVVHQLRQRSIGRITTDRDGHQLHRHRHQQPGRDRGRTRRRPVVHQLGSNSIGRITDRRNGHQLHRRRHQSCPPGSRPGPTAPVVHQHSERLDRADQSRGHVGSRPARPLIKLPTVLRSRRRRRFSDTIAIGRVHQRRRAHRHPTTDQHSEDRDERSTPDSCSHRCDEHSSRPCVLGGCKWPEPVGHVTIYRDGISRPAGIVAGPGRRAVVHQLGQRLDRADHDGRRGHQLHRHRIIAPGRDRGRAGRRAVVHQRRATTRSGGSRPPAWSPTSPAPASATRTGSRPGPTARCGSPTTATTRSGGSRPRDGHQLHRRRHRRPARDRGRARRRAVVHQHGDGSIGRITTAATVTTTPAPASAPARDRGRAGRRAVVHQLDTTLDRADHHGRDGHQLHGSAASTARRDRGRTRRRAVVHELRATTRSGGSPPAGRSPTSPAPASATPTGSRPGPTARCGSPTRGTDSIGRITTAGTVDQLHRRRHQRPDGITAGPDGALWFTNTATTRSAGSPPRDGHQLHRPGISGPYGITAGPDGALWFTNHGNDSIGRITTAGTVTNYTGPGSTARRDHGRPDGALWFTNYGERLDRADHHRGSGHQLHRHRHQRPLGITAGPDGALWFTNYGDATRSGGSPPTGTVTNYTGAGIDGPYGIAAGPDGALWFTNSARDELRSGGSRPAGTVTNYTDPRHQLPGRHRGGARRRAVVHQLTKTARAIRIGRITTTGR